MLLRCIYFREILLSTFEIVRNQTRNRYRGEIDDKDWHGAKLKRLKNINNWKLKRNKRQKNAIVKCFQNENCLHFISLSLLVSLLVSLWQIFIFWQDNILYEAPLSSVQLEPSNLIFYFNVFFVFFFFVAPIAFGRAKQSLKLH